MSEGVLIHLCVVESTKISHLSSSMTATPPGRMKGRVLVVFDESGIKDLQRLRQKKQSIYTGRQMRHVTDTFFLKSWRGNEIGGDETDRA